MALMRFIFVLLVVVAFLDQAMGGVAVLNKRSLASGDSTNTDERHEICQGRTPCGWAIYNRTTRFIDYFMRNKCQCDDDKKCVRDDDDISITAYVYRCKNDQTQKSTS